MPISINGSGPIDGITSLNTTVSSTELGYLDGVSSAIQTQFNGKANTTGNGAWTSYTPALTASVTNPTLGTGSAQNGSYIQIGKLVVAKIRIAFGSSGAAAGSGDYYISLPVPAVTGFNLITGVFRIGDNNTNIIRAAFPLFFATSTTCSLRIDSTSGGGYTVTSSVPWTWAALDEIAGYVIYEAA